MKMKTKSLPPAALIAAAACVGAAASAAVPVAWTNSPGMPAHQLHPVPHGVPVDLRVTLRGYSDPPAAAGADVRLWFQTNGMGSAWWSAPATLDGDTIAARFGPGQDTGADRVSLFLGAPSNVYAAAVLRLTRSPGFAPASLPLPMPVLDFSAVELRNLYALTNGWSFGGGGAEIPKELSSVTNALKNYAGGRPSPGLTYGWYFGGIAEGALTAGMLGRLGQSYMPLFRYDGNASRWVSEWQWGTNKVAYLSDIPDPPDLSGYSRASEVETLSAKVAELQSWAIGDDVSLRVSDAGTTNASLSVSYTNATMYSSAAEHTNTLNAAKAFVVNEVLPAVDTALAGKANRAWGETTSGGAPSPESTLVVEKRTLSITGGGNYAYLESSTGGYWVMSISPGTGWTLDSLAAAQNPTNPATMTFRDADGVAAFTVTSGGTREVYAVSGEQYISVDTSGGDDVITLTYPVDASEHPVIEYAPSLDSGVEFAEASAANWPQQIRGVSWSGGSGAWVATVEMAGRPGVGFFRAVYRKRGGVCTRFDQPLELARVVIGGVAYSVTVETVDGRKLMVLAEAQR